MTWQYLSRRMGHCHVADEPPAPSSKNLPAARPSPSQPELAGQRPGRSTAGCAGCSGRAWSPHPLPLPTRGTVLGGRCLGRPRRRLDTPQAKKWLAPAGRTTGAPPAPSSALPRTQECFPRSSCQTSLPSPPRTYAIRQLQRAKQCLPGGTSARTDAERLHQRASVVACVVSEAPPEGGPGTGDRREDRASVRWRGMEGMRASRWTSVRTFAPLTPKGRAQTVS